ncbi:hypothetical protein NE237_021715 [Protea cynaroides]|uniref:Uncharacterized protein n=1 Tax=Protea cynaroides TaxID=273540 RepID=A0A9Q0K4M2_9MAGN|nr:hypothetical protein NE237_021715 [Protea cynaroides]
MAGVSKLPVFPFYGFGYKQKPKEYNKVFLEQYRWKQVFTPRDMNRFSSSVLPLASVLIIGSHNCTKEVDPEDSWNWQTHFQPSDWNLRRSLTSIFHISDTQVLK